MTSEFGEMREVVVTPALLKRYFSMTKTEILAHLFLLSVCDENRHIKRNVRALARETKRWHADVYRAIMGLKLKKMVEEKHLKTKGGKHWRVYPLPRERKDKSEKDDASVSLEYCPPSSIDDETIIDTETTEKHADVIADESAKVNRPRSRLRLASGSPRFIMEKPKRRNFFSWFRRR